MTSLLFDNIQYVLKEEIEENEVKVEGWSS
jgi:hypothetical protein